MTYLNKSGVVCWPGTNLPYAYRGVLLDLDHTVAISEGGEKFRPKGVDYKFLPGMREALEGMHAAGIALGIGSNQGGIGAGHTTYEEVEGAIWRLLRQLDFPVPFLFCPYFRRENEAEERSNPWLPWKHMRKPSPEMWRRLAALYPALTNRHFLVVGDMRDDQLSADYAGMDFMWQPQFLRLWNGEPEPARMRLLSEDPNPEDIPF